MCAWIILKLNINTLGVYDEKINKEKIREFTVQYNVFDRKLRFVNTLTLFIRVHIYCVL